MPTKPKCGHCSTVDPQISFEKRQLAGETGNLVFCNHCGAIFDWTPEARPAKGSSKKLDWRA